MNQTQKQKRCRSLNWDEEEKLLFRTVLKEYAHIIENKSLDTNTNKKKTEAWEEIHKKFNELNGRHRLLSQLKIQWKTMKINVRKSCSSFKSEMNKTGGGTRPTTPDDSILEIKDLLNPAELLKDNNIYDSDGIIPGSSENKVMTNTTETSIIEHQGSSSKTCAITLQGSKPMTYVVKALETCTKYDNINHDSQQTADICIETIEDVDAQAEYTPLVISQDNDVIVTTPINKKIGTSTAKKVPKRRIMNIPNNSLKSRKDHEDYIDSLISHSKILKDEEHRRRMEMAEEEHLITMQIKKEKLRSAILEREILEIKKAHEENSKSFQ